MADETDTGATTDVSASLLIKIIAAVLVVLAVGYGGYTFVTMPIASAQPTPAGGAVVTMLDDLPEGDIQQITIRDDGRGDYTPNPVRLKVGVPVELTTDPATRGCLRWWFSPKLGIRGSAETGKNVIYFVPNKKGSFPFSCTMNMGKGLFVVE